MQRYFVFQQLKFTEVVNPCSLGDIQQTANYIRVCLTAVENNLVFVNEVILAKFENIMFSDN